MEATNLQQAAPPAPSATPTASAPHSAAPSPMSSPSPYQASYPTAPQAPAQVAYQQQVAPQASAQEANPWQQAFQALSASLNTPNLSPAPAPYSAYQTQVTPTPQAATQPNWASMAPSVPQTYSAPASTQGFSAGELAYLQEAMAQDALMQQQAAPAADGYLSQISDESLEVLEHFGAECPTLLNTYACAVEDALIEQVQRGQSMDMLLRAAGEERGAMNLMLTDPDVLADYVSEFFGPNGPYPTETGEETNQRLEQEAYARMAQEINDYERNQVPANFQRPQMDMPTPGRSAQAANDFWGSFSDLMENNPEQAWQYLSSAPQGALQTKLLVQDL